MEIFERTFASSEEVLVINGMMINKDNLDRACFELNRDDFEKIENKVLFDCIVTMHNKGIEVNIGSVHAQNKDEIQRIGIDWLQYTNVFLMGYTFDILLERLKENSAKSKLLNIMGSISSRLKDRSITVEDATLELENNFIESNSTIKRDCISPKELTECCEKAITARVDKEERSKKVVYTGYKAFNESMGGFESGDLVILSGETGGGKSAFVNNLLKDIAIEQKIPVLYMNSEMSTDQISLRWACLLSGISHTKLRNGEISKEEHQVVIDKIKILSESQLFTVTIPDLKITSMISEIKRAKRRYDVRVVVVDYIGRVDMENASQDDWKVMTGAARKLKTLAQSLGIVVIMVAQLNAQGRLAQASYMTHEADLWLNLKKPEDKDIPRNAWWNICLEIKKGRNAPIGAMKLFFDGEKLTFYDKPIVD